MDKETMWIKDNEILVEKGMDLNPFAESGYIEIWCDGRCYRSVSTDHHPIWWVCWEPYQVLFHFSSIEGKDYDVQFYDNNIINSPLL